MAGVRDSHGRFVAGGGGGGHGSSVRLTDTDHGYDALLERVRRAAEGCDLTVGIHEAEGAEEKEGADSEEEQGLSLVDVASFHEFGLGVPRRSFIADWADESRASHEEQLRKIAQAVVSGKVESLEQGLSRLGSLWAAEVQKRIADGIEPELAESTIKRKGSSKPLINTGQLRSAIRPYLNGKPIE